MLIPGLVSITFRNLTPYEIVGLVRRAGLDAVEWGGDVHVPHGAIARAREVARLTLEAGLRIAAYGSYYRAGEGGGNPPFETVLETALALRAPTIRIWAGNRPSAGADDDYRRRVVDDIRRIAREALAAHLGITIEFHGGTLTDANESTIRLMNEIPEPNVTFGWQPAPAFSEPERTRGLEALRPRLGNLHVFTWSMESDRIVQHPLADGEDAWRTYLALADATPGDRGVLIEFVRDGDPAQFLEDAAVLRRWLNGSSGKIQ